MSTRKTKLESRPGYLWVKTSSYVTNFENTEDIRVPNLIQNPANISLHISNTYNLGNYESVKIEVGISLPCQPSQKDIDQTYDYALGVVDKKSRELAEQAGIEFKDDKDEDNNVFDDIDD